MDISETLAPNSDQLDAIELVGHPRTFVIDHVSKGNTEQPINVHLVDFPRPWRPGKSMRRVLAACWGTDASQWAGRSVRLYCDEKVRFGSEVVGGTRISHLSHIDARKSVPLLVSRGKSAMFTVEPLKDAPTVNRQSPNRPAGVDLGALFDGAQIPRPDRLAFVRQTIGRDVTSPADLTPDETAQVARELATITGGAQ